MSALLIAALVQSAPAAELVVRNDTAYDDSFDTSDNVAWLSYPECAISVLTPDPADLPLSIDTIRFYFGSSQGNQDGTETLAEVGIQLLAEGAAPTGMGSWAWGEEGFLVTVQSTTLTDLSLDQPEEGLYPLQITEGSMAVWICPPDPATGEGWPFTNSRDTSGIVIHSDSPDAGNYVYYDGAVRRLSELGAQGSWIIRAVQGGEGGASGSGGGGDGGSGDGGSGDGASDGGSGADDGGSDTAGPMAIDRVVPQGAVLGEAVEVVILGQGFAEDSRASIGGLPLSSLERSGGGALAGRSPSGLPVGVHDVTVETDAGAVTLEAAFTVTEGALAEEGDDPSGKCGCANAGGRALGLGGLLAPLVALRRRSRRED